MIIANHLLNLTELDEVWLVVSPHNPLKKKDNLADAYDRLHLVELAIDDHPSIRPCNIEFELPVPSYTIDTLTYLQEKYPGDHFCLVMGSDNIKSFHKWKNYEMILDHYPIYVYQRPGSQTDLYTDNPGVKYLDAPLLDMSASFIRKLIREGKSVRYMVPDKVFDSLEKSSLYRV